MKIKRLSLGALVLLLAGCVVSETYLVHRCTTIFTKTSCVEADLELNKPKDKTDDN